MYLFYFYDGRTESKFLLRSFRFAVIVTEKKNILLRYLHQQWDKKVKYNIFVFFCARSRFLFLNFIVREFTFFFLGSSEETRAHNWE